MSMKRKNVKFPFPRTISKCFVETTTTKRVAFEPSQFKHFIIYLDIHMYLRLLYNNAKEHMANSQQIVQESFALETQNIYPTFSVSVEEWGSFDQESLTQFCINEP